MKIEDLKPIIEEIAKKHPTVPHAVIEESVLAGASAGVLAASEQVKATSAELRAARARNFVGGSI